MTKLEREKGNRYELVDVVGQKGSVENKGDHLERDEEEHSEGSMGNHFREDKLIRERGAEGTGGVLTWFNLLHRSIGLRSGSVSWDGGGRTDNRIRDR